MATTAGIACYNGFIWKHVEGTPIGRFTTFEATPDNRIVATIGDECFIGDTSGFQWIPSKRIQEAVPWGKDSLLLLSDQRLYIYSDTDIYPFDALQTAKLGEVEDIWRTSNGNNWIATLSAIYKWERGEWVPKIVSPTPGLRISNRLLRENRQGSCFVVVDQPVKMWGLWEWNNDKRPVQFHTSKSSIHKATLSENNDLLVIHESGSKKIRAGRKWYSFRLNHLVTRDIEFLQYRKNGDVWFGTQHGLYLYRNSARLWTYVHNESPDFRKSINEIVVGRDSLLWLATSFGIEVHYPDGSVKNINEINGTVLDMVTGLTEDKDGNIWISSGGSFAGAYKWDGKEWTWYGDGTPLAYKRIHKIKKDRRGRLWFLSLWPHKSLLVSGSSLGADVYDNGKFVEHWGTEQGLLSKQVYSFAEGKDGTLWFGSATGLSRYRNGIWKHWSSSSPLQPNPLGRVFALTLDSKDKVWFTNRTSGIWYVDEQDSLRSITTEDGLINNEVWDIRVDSLDRLWITTGGGLSCYDHGNWTSVDSKTGLLDSELWPVVPVGNKVYVGSRSGVSILDLTDIHEPNPIVVIEKPATQENSVLLRWKPLAYWGSIETENILTRYRINNGRWSAWSKVHNATVGNLDAGKHTVDVQALGFFSDFEHYVETRSFSINRKFYWDPGFYVPVGALALLAISLGVNAIAKKKRYDNEIRESESKFRAITETTSSAIFIYNARKILFANASSAALTGYSNEEFLSLSILNILHPDAVNTFKEGSLAFTALPGPNRTETKIQKKKGPECWVDYMEGRIDFHGVSAVVGTAFDITERKLAEGKNIENQHQLRLLASELVTSEERERRRMAVFLHDAIGQTLALCKLKVGSLQHALKMPSADKPLAEIKSFLDQAIQNTRSLTSELSPPILHELGLVAAIEWIAEKMQEQSTIRFECTDDGEVKPMGEELSTLLFHAVRELLVNAVKHSKASSVRITIERKMNTIWITVADDGIGSEWETVSPSLIRKGGFGLFNIRERLHHFGGTMNISAVRGAGTKIVLTSPLSIMSVKD